MYVTIKKQKSSIYHCALPKIVSVHVSYRNTLLPRTDFETNCKFYCNRLNLWWDDKVSSGSISIWNVSYVITFIFETLCLNARQPGKVLNGLNARKSEIFTEFPLKDSFKLLDDIWCFFRNVKRFQKLCSFARWRNNRACAHYKISMCLTLAKFTLTSAVTRDHLTNCWQKASFEPNEKMQYLFQE